MGIVSRARLSLVLAVLLGATEAFAGAPATRAASPTSVDAPTCQWVISSLKAVAADPVYGPQLLAVLPPTLLQTATAQDCTVETTSGIGPTGGPRNGISPMTYGVTYGFWKQMDFYIEGWSLFQWHVNAGIRWASARSWTKAWGADCYLTSVPGYFGGYDQGGWCGIYDPGYNDVVQPGSNFWISPIPLPLYKRWGWMRYWAYSDGSSSSPWGGWS